MWGFDFNKDPGTENLNLRAYFATIVGPRRMANSARSIKQGVVAGTGNAGSLARNGSRQQECLYVEVWLPQKALADFPTGLWVGFGSSDGVGDSADRVLLSPVAGQSNSRYHSVLLPDDELFALVLSQGDGTALTAGSNVPLVVGQVFV
jgi:hypothetical protein